jgi:glutathione S-transferase
MKLFGSPGSPYARKVRIVLAEKQIPHEYIVARGSAPGSPVPQFNPLGKIPTLVLDDGRGLYDSPVIVEYLDTLGSGPRLIPEAPAERIEVRRWEALGDGITEATVNINHEYREPKEKQRAPEWFERQRAKIDRGLAVMEKDLGAGQFCFGGRFSLADIAAGYALGYLDFALAEVEWRKGHPALARLAERLFARASFNSTDPAKPKQ